MNLCAWQVSNSEQLSRVTLEERIPPRSANVLVSRPAHERSRISQALQSRFFAFACTMTLRDEGGRYVKPYCSVREATRIAVSRTMLTSAPVETVEPLSLPHIIEMRPPVGSSATDVNERVPDEMLVPLTKG